jgi:hypothetical protein
VIPTPPAGGLCQTGKDPLPWVAPERLHQAYGKAAARLCERECPALDGCREYAAGFAWRSVVIAGWRAPRLTPARPPWAT